MRRVAVIVLLAFVALVHAKELMANVAGNAQYPMDSLVSKLVDKANKLFDREVNAPLPHYAELDNTTHGKPNPRAISTPRLSPLGRWYQRGPSIVAATKSEQRIAQQLAYEIGKASTLTLPFEHTTVGSCSYYGMDPQEPGRNKVNQDRGCVVYPFGSNDKQALFAVFDGHGPRGERVSEFAMQVMQKTLETYPGLVGNEVAAFEAAFTTADRMLAHEKKAIPEYSGSTAVAALLRSDKVWVANAGDSRCVLASKNLLGVTTKDLSSDHKPDSPGEQGRIEQSGGFVSPRPEPTLSARVWLDAEMTKVGLSMARSIGDHAAKKVGVIASPEVKVYDLNGDDLFMILATDGLWEFISSQEATEIVWGVLQSGGGATKATKVLIETAALRWLKFEGNYRDDITVIVITLPCFDHVAQDFSKIFSRFKKLEPLETPWR
jgi:serine/threonine protein phosphatase PrpC